MNKKTLTIAEIASIVGAEIRGDSACIITGVAPLESATSGEASYYDNPRYRKHLESTNASVVVLAEKNLDQCNANALISNNPYLAHAKLVELFQSLPKANSGIHPTAVIGSNCKIAATASIGPHCVIEDGTTIGENTIIRSGCMIGEDCKIGDNCQLWSNVTLYYNVSVGNNTIIHSGVVLGADGFGIAMKDDKSWHKVPQIGGVMIGNDVEIGANTTIDRGALGDTVIGNGVKLDNQIQIGHNVHIDDHTVIAGCAAIAGSAKIGKHCMIGGGAGILGHITLTDGVIITGMTGIAKSIKEPGIYSAGIQAEPRHVWKKNANQFRHLYDIAMRLKKLEKTIES